jgi:hypothetical protein
MRWPRWIGRCIVKIDVQAVAFLDAAAQRVHAIKQREGRRCTCTMTVLSTLLVLAASDNPTGSPAPASPHAHAPRAAYWGAYWGVADGSRRAAG